MVVPKNRSKERYFLDLFAGSGGFTLGLKSSGFTSLGSIEINDSARQTLQINFGETPLRAIQTANGDVTKINLPGLKSELLRSGVAELDLLVACPPCQAFSRIGRGKLDSLAGSKGSHPSDPRNRLYRKVVHYLSVLKPKAFVFENVPGMLSVGRKNIAELMCRGADQAGYTVKAAVLNAAWFGVPQFRERIIIIGFRNDLEIVPTFPEIHFDGPEIEGHMSGNDNVARLWSDDRYFVPYSALPKAHKIRPFRTVEDALKDLPAFTEHLKALRYGRKYKSLRSFHCTSKYLPGEPNEFARLMRTWPGYESDGLVSDHFCRWTPRDFRIFQKMKEGDAYPEALCISKKLYALAKRKNPSAKMRDFIPPYPDDSFKEKWRKLIRHRPSWTVTAHLSKDSYSHIHYDSAQARAITIREAARLQSFPDGFKFHGCSGDVLRQIGNAVPPLLSREIGRSLFKQLATFKKKASVKNKRGEIIPTWTSNREIES